MAQIRGAMRACFFLALVAACGAARLLSMEDERTAARLQLLPEEESLICELIGAGDCAKLDLTLFLSFLHLPICNRLVTPLRLAIDRGDTACAKSLLDVGVQPEREDLLAVAPGDLGIMQALLDAGADLDDADEEGNTPLMHAAAACSEPAVNLLLGWGAWRWQKNVEGLTAESLWGSKCMNANTIFGGGKTACRVLQQDGQLGWSYLDSIPSGWQTEPACEQGTTLLQLAVGLNLAGAVDMLLNKGASPLGWKSLALAVSSKNLHMVRQLIGAGADPNARNENGETALMYAAAGCDWGVVATLVSSGADTGAVNKQGNTALDVWHAECTPLPLLVEIAGHVRGSLQPLPTFPTPPPYATADYDPPWTF